MSDDLSHLTCCVVDHGFGIGIARKLAESYGRVLYHRPWFKSYPLLTDCIIGDGCADIERCDDFWLVKDEIDLFVFPDLYHQGEQAELKKQGFPVWGSQRGMSLEINRQFFMRKLEELGLEVPPHQEVVGLTALTKYLHNKEDIFIKVSKYRGTWETKHWRSWAQDSHQIAWWSVKFGGVKEKVHFLCFDKIETVIEAGADTYCVDGQWADTMLHGIEHKDESLFTAVTKKADMPEELTHIMDAFSPFLKDCQSRTQWSMEVRITEDKAYFIDATVRLGLPSTGSQLATMKNFAKVIYYGANGELIQPEYDALFTAECMVRIKGEHGTWETVQLDDELKTSLMLCDYCEIDGMPWFPPDEGPIEEIGWLVSKGQTPVECAKEMNRLADLLPDGADAAVESLSNAIREIEEEEKAGVHFTDQKMPEPQIVLEPA